jgi:large repetitive protein
MGRPDRNLRPYRAIAALVAGEDLRSSKARSLHLNIHDPLPLWNRAWARPGRILGYLLCKTWATNYEQTPAHQNTAIDISSQIKAGDLEIPWWQADSGEMIWSSRWQHPGGALQLPVPPPPLASGLQTDPPRCNGRLSGGHSVRTGGAGRLLSDLSTCSMRKHDILCRPYKGDDMARILIRSLLLLLAITPVWCAASVLTVAGTDGTYNTGSELVISVEFSEAVFVTDTPTLKLQFDDETAPAAYVTSSALNTILYFSYIVQSQDTSADLDYASIISLTGTIKDGSDAAASLILPAPGAADSLSDTSDIIVNPASATPPAVSSVTSTDGIYAIDETVTITITFDQAVDVVGTPHIVLSNGSTAAATAQTDTDTVNFTYTVAANDNNTPSLNNSANIILEAAEEIYATGDSSNDSNLSLNGFSLSDSYNITIDATPPTMNSAAITNTDGTYGIGDTITIKINTSEDVTVTGSPTLLLSNNSSATYDAIESESDTLWFNYVIAAGDTSTDSLAIASTPLTGIIIDIAGNAITNDNSNLTLTKTISIDATAPTISTVTAAFDENTIYGIEQSIDFTVTFDDEVSINKSGGTPALQLTNNASAPFASSSTADGVTTAIFRYTVSEGDTDTAAVNIKTSANETIELNGGSITNTAGNSLDQSSATTALPNDITIDATKPTITGVSTTQTDTIGIDKTITFTVTCSENIGTISGSPEFALSNGGTAVYDKKDENDASKLIFAYTVADDTSHTTSDLTIEAASAIVLGGGSITDANGNALQPGLPQTPFNVNVDATRPTIVVVSSDATGIQEAGTTIAMTIDFSEALVVTDLGDGEDGTLTLSLNASAQSKAEYQGVAAADSSILEFTYTFTGGDQTNSLDYSDTNALALADATITDSAGNDAVLSLPSPNSSGSLGDSTDISIQDGTAPTIDRFTANTLQGSFKEGNKISITVHFDENIDTSGVPKLGLLTNQYDDQPRVTYALFEDQGDDWLEFLYTVEIGDETDRLDVYELLMNHGTITDAADNPLADLVDRDDDKVLPRSKTVGDETISIFPHGTNETGSLAQGYELRLDTLKPTATRVYATSDSYKTNDRVEFSVEFSEIVRFTSSSPRLSLETGSGSTREAAYLRGNGTNKLVFDYTVMADDSSENPIDVRSEANGLRGIIKDRADNIGENNLPYGTTNPNALPESRVFFNESDPDILSASAPADRYGIGDEIEISITFSEPMELWNTTTDSSVIVDDAYLAGTSDDQKPVLLVALGAADHPGRAVLDPASVDDGDPEIWIFTYVVREEDSLGATEKTLDTTDTINYPDTWVIRDIAGNVWSSNDQVDKSGLTDAKIDTTRPTVTGIEARSLAATYLQGDTIDIAVLFSEDVRVSTGTPTLQLQLDQEGGENSDGIAIAAYNSELSAPEQDPDSEEPVYDNKIVFTYTVQNGDLAQLLDITGTDALIASDGSIEDLAGNGLLQAGMTLPEPGADGSLAASSMVVDGESSGTGSSFEALAAELNAVSISAGWEASLELALNSGWEITDSQVEILSDTKNLLQISHGPSSGGAGKWLLTLSVAEDTVLPTGEHILAKISCTTKRPGTSNQRRYERLLVLYINTGGRS